MDNITELLNLQSKHFYAKRSAGIKELTYYADPKIARFPKVLKFKKGDSISIQVTMNTVEIHESVRLLLGNVTSAIFPCLLVMWSHLNACVTSCFQ